MNLIRAQIHFLLRLVGLTDDAPRLEDAPPITRRHHAEDSIDEPAPEGWGPLGVLANFVFGKGLSMADGGRMPSLGSLNPASAAQRMKSKAQSTVKKKARGFGVRAVDSLADRLKDDGPAPKKGPKSPRGAAAPGALETMDADDLIEDVDGDDDSMDRDAAANAQEEWAELQAFIQKFEQQGISLAGVDIDDPVSYWIRHFAVEASEMEGNPRAQAVVEQGFGDVPHWDMVCQYVIAKWSVLGHDDDGEPAVVQRDEFTNSMMKARMQGMQQMQSQAAAADPSLLAPVHGVSVDQWAQISAGLSRLGAGTTDGDVDRFVRQYGIDRATWDAANAGWQAKMQSDTSFVIATKYGEAFSGATGAATGAGAGGGEPCPFERWVEIMTAQTVWAEQGHDVNAMIQSQFGILTADFGQYSQYWSPKIATDIALVRRQGELEAHYRRLYGG